MSETDLTCLPAGGPLRRVTTGVDHRQRARMRMVRLYTDTSNHSLFRVRAFNFGNGLKHVDGKLIIQFPVVILPTPDSECPSHLPADRSTPLTRICSALAVAQDRSGTLRRES